MDRKQKWLASSEGTLASKIVCLSKITMLATALLVTFGGQSATAQEKTLGELPAQFNVAAPDGFAAPDDVELTPEEARANAKLAGVISEIRARLKGAGVVSAHLPTYESLFQGNGTEKNQGEDNFEKELIEVIKAHRSTKPTFSIQNIPLQAKAQTRGADMPDSQILPNSRAAEEPRQYVESLQRASIQLDMMAGRLELAKDFEAADRIRELGKNLRIEARRNYLATNKKRVLR